MKKILIIIFLLYGNCYAQPSWDFDLWFNLLDSQGNKIGTTEFSSLNAYVPYGSKIVIRYDTIAEMYNLAGKSVIPTSYIVLVTKQDTTTIGFSTDKSNLCLGNIAVDGYDYNFIVDDVSADKFNCKESLNGYDNRQVCRAMTPLSSFRIAKLLGPTHMDFENKWNSWSKLKLEE